MQTIKEATLDKSLERLKPDIFDKITQNVTKQNFIDCIPKVSQPKEPSYLPLQPNPYNRESDDLILRPKSIDKNLDLIK